MVNGTFERVAPQFGEAHMRGEIDCTGVFSHLACAGSPTIPPMTCRRPGSAGGELLSKAGVVKQINHLSNSPGALPAPTCPST